MSANFVRAVAVFGVFALAACEDNPDQFFKVAPKGAGQLWNDGATKPYSDAARNSFNDNFNGVSKDSLCDAPKKHDTWSAMVMQPIVPSSKVGITAGGINISGDNWKGLVFKDAQAKLCQANPLGIDDQELTAAWGDSNQVQVSYKINNSTVDYLQLNQGYRGTLDFKSRPHALGDDSKEPPWGANHTYQIGVGTPILKDGKAVTIDWGNNGANFSKLATELYDSLMYTFAPELKSTQGDCSAEQSCLAHPVGGGLAAFGARPLGIYFQVPSITQQPQASTPSIIYAFPVKLLPFSGASMMLKLDEEGPIGTSLQLGDKLDHDCTQKLGQTYQNFLDNCVNVQSDKAQNDGIVQKLFGGYGHDKESYNFTVQGVDTDFASTVVGDDKIVGDSWRPDPKDTVLNFNIDIRATGKLLNEYSEDGNTFTFGATGAIYREFARRVQEDIHKQMKSWAGAPSTWSQTYDIGAADCVMKDGDTTWTPKPGCTGMEQFVTPAEHTTQSVSADTRKMSLGGDLGKAMGFLSALKPGDPIAIFCADPPPHDGADAGASCSADNDCWSNKCGDDNKCTDPTDTYFQHCGDDDQIGAQGAFFETVFERVRNVLGGGNVVNLPPALRDVKYYFTHFGYALVKYLMTAGLSPRPTNLDEPQYGPTGTACNGRTCEPNPDHLQFDQVGQGSEAMKLEYIDRRWADHGKDPISYEYQILIIASNQQESRFRQHLDRDERAVFQSMAADLGKPLLDEANNLRITNLIGSNILAGRWVAASATKDAYFCATHVDTDCTKKKGTNHAPMVGGQMEMDDKGQPLLTDYRGAFTGTPFSLGTNFIKLIKYDGNNEQAVVEMPNFKDPYNTKSGGLLTTPAHHILPDWRPLAPGAGFPIPVNGQRDKFIPSAAIDLSGQNLSMNLDYVEQEDHSFKIQATEAQTFEGEIFLCEDPITHDFLHIRQYDSIAEVQDWILHHPGVQDACDLTMREAPSSKDPVMILAKKAGISATVGQGSGVGRIIDVLFYDPTLE